MPSSLNSQALSASHPFTSPRRKMPDATKGGRDGSSPSGSGRGSPNDAVRLTLSSARPMALLGVVPLDTEIFHAR